MNERLDRMGWALEGAGVGAGCEECLAGVWLIALVFSIDVLAGSGWLRLKLWRMADGRWVTGDGHGQWGRLRL